MIATTHCNKCGETIRIDFGTLTKEEAVKKLDELNSTPMECPGFHVELGGWKNYWNFSALLVQAYPERMGTKPDPRDFPTVNESHEKL